tara:strand:+ start:661 stop:894 length:234 start_codon:yes stop_codon:yes gene_type:complete
MQVVLYTNGSQECERAKTLLERLSTQIGEYKLNKDFTQKAFNAEFGDEAEYPQVAIGYKHIGGLKDTLHYFQENNLL